MSFPSQVPVAFVHIAHINDTLLDSIVPRLVKSNPIENRNLEYERVRSFGVIDLDRGRQYRPL